MTAPGAPCTHAVVELVEGADAVAVQRHRRQVDGHREAGIFAGGKRTGAVGKFVCPRVLAEIDQRAAEIAAACGTIDPGHRIGRGIARIERAHRGIEIGCGDHPLADPPRFDRS
ncbi:hypothetical protein ACVIJW_005654 [Bradyrhizobium barranii subsp. barranii]